MKTTKRITGRPLPGHVLTKAEHAARFRAVADSAKARLDGRGGPGHLLARPLVAVAHERALGIARRIRRLGPPLE